MSWSIILDRPISQFSGSVPMPLVQIAYPNVLSRSLIATTSKPVTNVTTTVASFNGAPLPVPLPQPVNRISAVSIAGHSYRPAADPTVPTVGEFVFNSVTQQLTIYPIAAVQVGMVVSIVASTGVATDIWSGTTPALIRQLPITAGFNIGLSLNQSPRGSLAILCPAKNGESVKRSILNQWSDPFGIALRISELNSTQPNYRDSLDRQAEISINLAGKWDWFLDRQSPLVGNVRSSVGVLTYSIGGGGLGTVGSDAIGSAVERDRVVQRRTTTTLTALATAANVSYKGPNVTIDVPAGTSLDETKNWYEVAKQVALINSSFLDLSNPDQIRAIPYNSTALHYINEAEMLSGFEASVPAPPESPSSAFNQNVRPDAYSPLLATSFIDFSGESVIISDRSYIKAPISWGKISVSGDFKADGEKDEEEPTGQYQQRPDWRQKSPINEQKWHDPDQAAMPPASRPKELSSNFDNSGETKTRTYTELTDGFPDKEVIETFGWKFYASHLLNNNPQWEIVEQRVKTYSYSSEGYQLGWVEAGYKWTRLKKESDSSPESLESDFTTSALYAPYLWIKVPILGYMSRVLEQIRDYFPDFQPEPQYVLYDREPKPGEAEALGLDTGTAIQDYVIDPTYVEPMFVSKELEWAISYSELADPESQGIITSDSGFRPLLIAGHEIKNRLVVDLPPKRGRLITTGSVNRRDFSASDNQLKNSVLVHQRQPVSTQNPPGEAERRPALWERIPEEEQNGVSYKNDNNENYDYFISDETSQVLSGSKGYEYAKTVSQVLAAAKTEFYEECLNSGVKYTTSILFNPELKPGDRAIVTFNNYQYQCRIIQVDHEPDYDYQSDHVTGTSKLTFAPDYFEGPSGVPLNLSKKLKPEKDDANKNPLLDINLNPFYAGKKIGSIVEPDNVVYRRVV